jgi:very-short-patch-repair endonuclease
VEVTDALEQLGGIAARKPLLAMVSRQELERAVAAGAVVRARRGVYSLPTDDRAQQAAREHTAVAVLVTAAAHWQWPRKWEPRKLQLAVPRGRTISPETRDRLEVRWRAIPRTDVVDGWVTNRERTVLDCALLLPFDEALAVADSALRSGQVERRALLRRVDALDPQLRPRARRVVALADPVAANPFESVLRAIALDVPGLSLRAQVRIDDADGWVGRVDLADDGLRIVLEADSMEYHGAREVMDKDCARYTRLVADDWLVLRLTWTQVMTKPDWVRARVAATVRRRQAELCPACRAAS